MEIAVIVAQASEAFMGQCFRCNQMGHQFCDEECEMFDHKFLNTPRDLQKQARAGRPEEQKASPN